MNTLYVPTDMLYTGFKLYDRFDEECSLLLAQWYTRAYHDGSLSQITMKETRSLAEFFRLFEGDNTLLYFVDDNGIFLASWLTPTGTDTAFFSLWVREDKRKTKLALGALHECYVYALRRYKTLIMTTKQPRLLRTHRRLGYVIYEPPIPGAWDGEDMYVGYLTREAYYGVRLARW